MRRWLLVAVAVVVVAAGAAVAAVLLTRGSSGPRLASAAYPGYNLSFRYPSTWRRVDWCETGTVVSPIAVLTTARKAPKCAGPNAFSFGTPFPPPQLLPRNGLTVALQYSNRSRLHVPPANATVGGRPASVRAGWKRVPHITVVKVGAICGKVGTRERTLVAQVPHVVAPTGVLRIAALICGPDFAAGEAAVRRVLATVRFTG